MVLTGICVTIIVWVVVKNVPIANFGVLPRVLVVVLLVLFVIASFATTEVIPWHSRSWIEWRRPKVLGHIVYLLLGAAGFIGGVANIFGEPLASRKDVQALSDKFGIGRASLVREHIGGLWGRPGCKVTYRATLRYPVLSFVSEKDPPGVDHFVGEYTITGDQDRVAAGGEPESVMETREVKGVSPGYSVAFIYRTNGRSETLFWDHRILSVNGITLVRC